MTAISDMTPRLIQRMRGEILVAMKRAQWQRVKELDARLSVVVDRAMASPVANLPRLSRELSINLALYREILEVSGQVSPQ